MTVLSLLYKFNWYTVDHPQAVTQRTLILRDELTVQSLSYGPKPPYLNSVQSSICCDKFIKSIFPFSLLGEMEHTHLNICRSL